MEALSVFSGVLGKPGEVIPPKGRGRGRKRGSTSLMSVLNTEKQTRKRQAEVSVGDRIRRLRIEAGMSQEELARASQMSTSYISRLEGGEVNPTVDALTRMVRVFDLSIDALLQLDCESTSSLPPDTIDPEIKSWLLRLKGKRVSARTKRILQTVIEEELKAQEEQPD